MERAVLYACSEKTSRGKWLTQSKQFTDLVLSSRKTKYTNMDDIKAKEA